MNTDRKRSSLGALAQGALGGLQWRLALLWILVTLLPAAVVALPLWRVLDGLLGHSVHADAWASHFDGLMFGDTWTALTTDNPWTGMALVAGTLVTLVFAPFLAGMVVAGGRANRALGFGGLLQGGATEYGRMLRLGILALIPYGLFIAAAYGVTSLADDRVETSLLASRAEMYEHGALAVAVLLFVVAQAIVESARAQFIADIGLRSAFVALGRGFAQCLRRPFATLFVYLVITLVGSVLLVTIASWRGHTTATGSGFWTGFLIVQIGVIVTAWMRTARLLALAGLAAISPHRRRRTDFAPAL
ncbi:hypothetical protein SAMN02800692_1304 [Luteibacter sp. UNC138MFCol5.1]|uniref:hypothetical protein n=1 Tax=Luteibacter sp. UNC138MFCol5.1 TaxID=1502774 RepID=UPI0008C7D897|nr:hypothetical protein [Luteibacter sp. UNC138MFCol5.1]SEO59259.1 hypothetical protein SAMN02800692_1304 [Luteibacter sp. UNC138MFCol5.1]